MSRSSQVARLPSLLQPRHLSHSDFDCTACFDGSVNYCQVKLAFKWCECPRHMRCLPSNCCLCIVPTPISSSCHDRNLPTSKTAAPKVQFYTDLLALKTKSHAKYVRYISVNSDFVLSLLCCPEKSDKSCCGWTSGLGRCWSSYRTMASNPNSLKIWEDVLIRYYIKPTKYEVGARRTEELFLALYQVTCLYQVTAVHCIDLVGSWPAVFALRYHGCSNGWGSPGPFLRATISPAK